jgi:hypothetical protein
MDFVAFLESIKTDKNKNLIENVAIATYKSLLEEILPAKPEETQLVIDKTKEDLEDLGHLKETQAELLQNEAELKQKAPDLVQAPQ